MGVTEFLVVGGKNALGSLRESVERLQDTSVIFVDAMQRIPPDVERAGRVSIEALSILDHIVNELLRERDELKATNSYLGSELKDQLDAHAACSLSPVTRIEQLELVEAGPGCGKLLRPGSPISMEKLLNKIKHRRKNEANYRIDDSGKHYFYIAVDNPNQKPDSIVEFGVEEFCRKCEATAFVRNSAID